MTPGNSAVSRLVERQMRNWELGKAQHPQTRQEAARIQDFVTLSQAPGSDGETIAQRVGERLKWPVFDKQLLLLMAHDDEARARLYASLDERDMGWLEKTFRPWEDPALARSDYFHRLIDTVLALARQGNAVFLGRAVDLVLPKGMGLRVRLVAPRGERIARLARQHELSEAQAAIELERLEAQQSAWLRHHFHEAAEDPARFDLVVNCGVFSIDQAVKLILEAVKERGTAGHCQTNET
jgi:cytidylate kinase